MYNKKINIKIIGIAQGVGFRPFVFHLAKKYNLNGWIKNNAQGVEIEVEGSKSDIKQFLISLEQKKPKLAQIFSLKYKYKEYNKKTKFLLKKNTKFFIKSSTTKNTNTPFILPDVAICTNCINELNDLENRRYRYPFITCTDCGPRFSIIEKTPYDRKSTTMRHFPLCKLCQKEYDDHQDRRFHAESISCNKCGPRLQLWDNKNNLVSEQENALKLSIQKIKEGKIIALKGIGGFQFICNAINFQSIKNLRERKKRPLKPFAVMLKDLKMSKKYCHINTKEEKILTSYEAPIVLLKQRKVISSNINFNNPYLGVMLPCSPLHYLILHDFNHPIIATSGNLSNEPICIDENEALIKFTDIADFFLIHNRKIERPLDDSIIRIINNKKIILRRARGYTPLPVVINKKIPPTASLGGELKNTFTLAKNKYAFISQHLGDLNNVSTYEVFKSEFLKQQKLFNIKPKKIIHDPHPQYSSTVYAKKINLHHNNNSNSNITIEPCYHHLAHIFATMIEYNIDEPVLGISWDGTGLGMDNNSIWGGEFFYIENFQKYFHIGNFKKFLLLGGEKAITDPQRIALALLYEIYKENLFIDDCVIRNIAFIKNMPLTKKNIFSSMLQKKINSVYTSSVGRLFDGVSILLGIDEKNHFEGFLAMELEFLCKKYFNTKNTYDFQIEFHHPINLIKNIKKKSFKIENKANDQNKYSKNRNPFEFMQIGWENVIKNILIDLTKNDKSIIASKFHSGLVNLILQVAQVVKCPNVIISGGVFQNKVLTQETLNILQKHSFKAFVSSKIPLNDGGISLGQLGKIMK